MAASLTRSFFRWLVVVLVLLTTLPSRAQDGYRYINRSPDLHQGANSIEVDPTTGHVFLSCGDHRVREYDASFSLVRVYGDGFGSQLGTLNTPFGLLVQNGKLLVSEWGNSRVSIFNTTTGIAERFWEVRNKYTNGSLHYAWDISLLQNGDIGVGTREYVYVFSVDGLQRDLVIGKGYGSIDGAFDTAISADTDDAGNWYVSDAGNRRIQKFGPDGTWLDSWPVPGRAAPYGLRVYKNRIYVALPDVGTILAYGTNGNQVYSLDGLGQPTGFAFDQRGRMYVPSSAMISWVHVIEPYWNDATPPTSVATLTPVPDANDWTRGTSMNVTATDDASGNGVKEVRYQINDGAVVVVPGASATVPFTSDGLFTVKTWAVDVANNVEPPHTTTIKVDSTSPLSVAKLDKRTFSVSATDAASGVASILVSIDGGAELVYSGPIALDINEHTVAYRALDYAGNAETVRTVTLGGIRISKLAATPSTVKGGNDVVLAAVLNAPAPAGGVSLTISSSAAAVTGTSVVIPEGELLALVSLKTVPVASDKNVVLSCSLGVSSASTPVTVLAEPLKLAVAPADIIGGANTLGTVSLLSAAPQGGTKIILSSGSSLVSVPSSVTVKAGKTTAVFTVRTKTVSATNTVNITAKTGVAESVATLTLRTPELINLDIDPSEVGSGGTTSGSIHLSCPAPTGGVKVTLTSTTKNLVVPATVVVAQGEVSADFIVKALPVASPSAATVTASLNGVVKQTDVNIVMPRLKNLAFLPAAATGGAQAKGTLSLNGIAAAAVTVAITSSNPALVPAQSIVMAKGKSVAPVLLKTNGVGSSTTVTITATAGGVSVTAELILLPQAVASVKLDKSSVKGGASVVGTITLVTPAVADTTVRVSASPSGVVTVPGTVIVAKGSKTATFTVLTNQTSVKRTVTLSAESDGVSKTAPLSVTP